MEQAFEKWWKENKNSMRMSALASMEEIRQAFLAGAEMQKQIDSTASSIAGH